MDEYLRAIGGIYAVIIEESGGYKYIAEAKTDTASASDKKWRVRRVKTSTVGSTERTVVAWADGHPGFSHAANNMPSLNYASYGGGDDVPEGLSLGACGDMGVEYGDGQVDITFSEPPALVVDGVTMATWQRTVAVMKVGYYPTSVTDGTIVAATSRDPSGETFVLPQGVSYGAKDAYMVSPATVSVSDASTARIMLFSCTRDGVWNAVTENRYPTQNTYSWGLLAWLADAGTFLSRFPVGTVLDMEHPDFPGAEWVVVGEDCFSPTDSIGGHHVGLVSRNALFSAPGDEREGYLAYTEDTAAVTGVKYALSVNEEIVQLTEGTDWDAGDTSCTYGGETYPISEWLEINPAGQNAGSNFTPQRNDVQWMNSDGAGGAWFAKQNLWDKCGSSLAARAGFLRNLPSTFRACLLNCARTCVNASPHQIRGRGSTSTFNAKVFPLAQGELESVASSSASYEGYTQLPLFAERGVGALLDSSYWLATALPTSKSNAMYLSLANGGTLKNNNGIGVSFGWRPACALGRPSSAS